MMVPNLNRQTIPVDKLPLVDDLLAFCPMWRQELLSGGVFDIFFEDEEWRVEEIDQVVPDGDWETVGTLTGRFALRWLREHVGVLYREACGKLEMFNFLESE